MKLSGKSVLITGASRGLGRALALELAARGARLTLVARDADALGAVAREARARGGEAFAVAADVSDPRAVYPIAAQAAELAGPVDVLINNASALGPTPLRLLLDTECEDLIDVLTTNVVGPFRLAKAVAGSMILRGGGAIVNISSDAAVAAYPRWGAYGASKAALDHLSRIWAAELLETPVRIVSVDPGEMDTKMHADAIPDADRASLARPEDVAGKLASVLERIETIESGSRLILPEVKP